MIPGSYFKTTAKALLTGCLALFIIYPVLSQSSIQEHYQWLEETYSDEVDAFVKEQNERTTDYLQSLPLADSLISVLESNFSKATTQRMGNVIPPFRITGPWANIINGVNWARMPVSSYLSGDIKPKPVLNLDSLAIQNNTAYSIETVECLAPDYNDCLVFFRENNSSRNYHVREYNTQFQSFVTDGFNLPFGRNEVFWKDMNSVYVSANDLGLGRELKLWHRGQSLAEAQVLLHAAPEDAGLDLEKIGDQIFIIQRHRNFDEEWFLVQNENVKKLDLPADTKNVLLVSGQLVVQLKSSWKYRNGEFASGSLISIPFENLVAGTGNFTLIRPSSREEVVDEIWSTRNVLIVRTLKNVSSQIIEFTWEEGSWQSRPLSEPNGGNISLLESQYSLDRYYLQKKTFISSDFYMRDSAGTVEHGLHLVYPWDDDTYEYYQKFATSKDGTKVPYFIVHKRGLEPNGKHPVIMSGYGGWGYSVLPTPVESYAPWMDAGGVYVMANIRGGNEYGPEWHYDAIREKRQNAYDDFQAIGDDLVKTNITSPGMIGIYGGSNGGILVAISMIQRPDLFGAVIGHVPTLELERCSLMSGEPPTGERGNAKIPEEWAFMKMFSPFHNLEEGKEYPPVLLIANREDDTVHPCHARKFFYRMRELGYQDVYYFETDKGGHGSYQMENQMGYELAFYFQHLMPDSTVD